VKAGAELIIRTGLPRTQDANAGRERRTRCPVEGVLQHPWNTVIVFRRSNHNSVTRGDFASEGGDWRQCRFDVEVFVVKGDVFEGLDRELHSWHETLLKSVQDRGTE
jgi:hypothetical protein